MATIKNLTEEDKKAIEHKIASLVQKIDSIHSSATCIQDIFTPQANVVRGKIQQHCLSICLNPDLSNDSVRKAEDSLWRKLFHSVVHAYKALKHRQPKQIEVDLVRNHLITGMGFYSNFIQMIASASNLNLEILDHLKVYVPLTMTNENEIQDEERKTIDQIRAKQTILRSLIYLGDICRYLDDLGSQNCRKLAIYWYNNALIWDPSVGMPHNQLATLLSGVNCDIDSCYHYLLCITSEKPFEGAEANLKRVMSRSLFSHGPATNKFSTPQTTATNSFDLGDESIVKKTIRHFLSIAYSLLYSAKTKTPFSDSLDEFAHLYIKCIETPKEPSKRIEQQSTSQSGTFILKNISTNKSFETSSSSSSSNFHQEKSNDKPDHLSNDITFKMAIMALMILMKCPSHAKANALALVVNFYFTLVTHSEKKVKEIIQQVKNNANFPSSSLFNGSESVSNLPGNEDATDSPITGKRIHRRRRRRMLLNDNSDESEGDSDESEALLEKIALRTIDALDITSDVSDDDYLTSEDEEGDEDENEKLDQVKEIASCEEIESEHSTLCAKLYLESPLATLKVYCDWIGANPHFFDSLEKATFRGEFCANLAQTLEQVISHDKGELGQSVRKDSCHGNEQKAQKCLSIDLALAKFPLLPQPQTYDVSRSCLSDSQSGYICASIVLNFIKQKQNEI